MSRTLNRPRWGLGATVAGLIGLALALLAAVGPVQRADAAFTTGKCAGDNVHGEGASFARDAHKVFDFNFRNSYCVGTPGVGTIAVSYGAGGSGAGRAAMQDRNHSSNARFGMVDDPPDALEIAKINAGTTADPATDSNPDDNGIVHVVPAAVGAAAILVNFPDECDPTKLDAESRTVATIDSGNENLVRVRFNKDELEGIFAKANGYENWDEVFDELHEEAGPCDEVPIIRVVRFDHSGTTFAVKGFLDTINGGRGWLDQFAGNDNRVWPNANFGPRLDCPLVNGNPPVGPGNDNPGPIGSHDPGPDQLTSGCASSNSSLADKVIAVDGSVGYSDISTARGRNFTIDPSADDNDQYWTQVPNGSGSWAEPTADANGFRTDGSKGSNCIGTVFAPVPSSTLGDWSPTTGVNALTGYGICTMTYGLVFDDNAAAWGDKPQEESWGRTVRDYWQNVLSDGAQGALFANDYAPLPTPIREIARTGINSVDWNKSGSGGGGGGGDENPPQGGGGDTGNTPPPVAKPSNAFSLPRRTIDSKTGKAAVSVKIPGAGRVVLVGTARVGKRTVQVGRVVLNAGRAGTYRLNLSPSRPALNVLRRKGQLRVALKVTFTPKGGDANATGSAVTLKLKKPKSGKRR